MDQLARKGPSGTGASGCQPNDFACDGNTLCLRVRSLALSDALLHTRYVWQDFVRNGEPWAHQMPQDPSRYLYRGMRIRTSEVQEVLLSGLSASKSHWGEIDFTPCPSDAISYGFQPGHAGNMNIPNDDFVIMVFQISSDKIPKDPSLNKRTVAHDVPSSWFTAIWIFDGSEIDLEKQFMRIW